MPTIAQRFANKLKSTMDIEFHPVYLWIGQIADTTLGSVWVAVSDKGLIALQIGTTEEKLLHLVESRYKTRPILDQERVDDIARQMKAYLEGNLRKFDIPIDWSGIPAFQKQVLLTTLNIPYGRTATYSEIAKRLGRPKAARAVGRAEATNPMPLVIPCHRVIGADGSLRGYGAPGGVDTKAKLLRLERGERNLF